MHSLTYQSVLNGTSTQPQGGQQILERVHGEDSETRMGEKVEPSRVGKGFIWGSARLYDSAC